MPWTGAFFLIGALAISGLPPLNGFASEWLAFQALLYGFRASTEPLVHFLFPVSGALLALTGALAATCFVKAFGISFLALPRSQPAAAAHEVPSVMLVPQVFLAALCVALGVFPGVVITALSGVMVSLPGLQPPPEMVRGPLGMAATAAPFATVTPGALGLALMGGLGAAAMLVLVTRIRRAVRRAPTWGCGGDPDAAHRIHGDGVLEAADDDLPCRVPADPRGRSAGEGVSVFSTGSPLSRRDRTDVRALRVWSAHARRCCESPSRLKILQAGSLHAYLGYVIALVLSLVLLVWWRG